MFLLWMVCHCVWKYITGSLWILHTRIFTRHQLRYAAINYAELWITFYVTQRVYKFWSSQDYFEDAKLQLWRRLKARFLGCLAKGQCVRMRQCEAAWHRLAYSTVFTLFGTVAQAELNCWHGPLESAYLRAQWSLQIAVRADSIAEHRFRNNCTFAWKQLKTEKRVWFMYTVHVLYIITVYFQTGSTSSALRTLKLPQLFPPEMHECQCGLAPQATPLLWLKDRTGSS